MRKGIVLLALLVLLTGQAAASEITQSQAEVFGVERLEKGLPDEAEALLGDHELTEQLDLLDGVTEIFSDAVKQSGGILRAASFLMLRILMIVVLCRLVENTEGAQVNQATALAGALAVTACCVTNFRSMIGLGKTTMDEISSFSTLLMPVMASAAAATGAPSRAGTLYTVTTAFSNVLIRFSTQILIPTIYGYLALALVDCALQEKRLSKLRELLGWCIRWGLKAVMYLFTGFLAVTGILSGSADAAALKAAKVTLSGMVPVVGGIISDAAETVLASGGLIKSAVGTFGMLAVLAVFALPFLRMGVHYLAFKLTAALSGLLESRLGGLLEALTDAMGFLLAMTGSSVLMCLISCCCFMRVVQL